MPDRSYYSVRTRKSQGEIHLSLVQVKSLFRAIYDELDEEGYFQEYFGIDCVDTGFTPGLLGRDIGGEVLLAIRKDHLWPIRTRLRHYTQEDVFDVIEFLYDHISKPTKRDYHSWNQCGWHCSEFDQTLGQEEFRKRINRVLKEYEHGFELSFKGQILALPELGLETLVNATLPASDPENVSARVTAAIDKFRRHRSSTEDRRDALRDLADVLEFLRPQVKTVLLSADERDLFNLANNFGIRHHNPKQKTQYDRPIWYSWLFYYYLATIHATLRFLGRDSNAAR